MAKIKMPNGHTVFLDNSVSDYHSRLELVQKHILDFVNVHGVKWEEYFDDAWDRETSVAGLVFNQTQDILERAATYLLMGQFKDGNILTNHMQNKIADKEIPASANSNAENLLYGSDDDDGSVTSVSEILNTDDVDKEIYNMSAAEIEQRKKKARKSKKKWKQTRTYKLNRLYSTPKIETYRVKPVKDQSGKTAKDRNGKLILQAVSVTIGGHNGLLNPTSKFQNVPDHFAQWCIVDTENKFTFDLKNYRIDDKLRQYSVSQKARKGDGGDWNNFMNTAEMDRILCYRLKDGRILFFDEAANPIDGSMIKEVTKD